MGYNYSPRHSMNFSSDTWFKNKILDFSYVHIIFSPNEPIAYFSKIKKLGLRKVELFVIRDLVF